MGQFSIVIFPHRVGQFSIAVDTEDHDIAFGLCDLGMGCAELGSVRLSELVSVRLRFGLSIERDRGFTATKTLLEYAREAWKAGYIIT